MRITPFSVSKLVLGLDLWFGRVLAELESPGLSTRYHPADSNYPNWNCYAAAVYPLEARTD